MRRRAHGWALLVVLGAGACSGKKAAGTAPRPGSGVLQRHNHANRDGVYLDPLMTKAAAAYMTLDPVFPAPTYAGPVDAQPLTLDGVDGEPDRLFIATGQNHVLAFDPATGAQAWDRLLGPPGVRPATVCSAGSFGIVGTPVIDGATRTLYVDAYTAADATTNKHLVFALDADTGATRPGWPVDVDVTARSGDFVFDSDVQNQRGALALVGGRLFVPYGAFKGDCGAYRGWVVGIAAADPTKVDAWATNSEASGIWAPGGISSDGTSIYFATGNGNGLPGPGWQGSEAAFRLPLSLARSDKTTDYYVPLDWVALESVDGDLGSTTPIPIDVPGATPSALLLALGKDKKAHLLDRNNLGGISAPLAGAVVSVNEHITVPAAYTTATGTYVAFRGPLPLGGGQAGALMITATAPPTITLAWKALDPSTIGSPSVSMTDTSGRDAIVWMVGTEFNAFYGFDGETGLPIYNGSRDAVPGVGRHQSPIIHKGRIFIAANDRIYVFKPSPPDAATD